MSERIIIERKCKTSFNWDIVAYPRNDIEEAKATLKMLKDNERDKKYKGEFRIVRETREIINA